MAILGAIPPATSLVDATSYSKTIAPYLSTEYLFPRVSALLEVRTLEALTTWYTATNPVATALIISQVVAVLAFVISSINGNYSQIDRIWSIIPAVYTAHYSLWARLAGEPYARVDLLTTVITIWGVSGALGYREISANNDKARLTFNYWRKGGYTKGSEDYRWEILRKHIKGPLWTLFNVTFISWYQSVLLFGITVPAYILLLSSRVTGLREEDIISNQKVDFWFSNGIILAIIMELFADQQQWAFHQAKAELAKQGTVRRGYDVADLARGFICDGLWGYSRHPNFLAEQLVWCLAYQWTCAVTGVLWNYAALFAFLYLALFQGSTVFTESISASKYPQYKDYQKKVAKFVPSYKAIMGLETFEEEGEETKKEK